RSRTPTRPAHNRQSLGREIAPWCACAARDSARLLARSRVGCRFAPPVIAPNIVAWQLRDALRMPSGPHPVRRIFRRLRLAAPALVFAAWPHARLGAQSTGPVATVGLTAGWATFGEAIPQGRATAGLQVGSLPTQTDVKNRWPDGSIKFAIV